MPPTTRQKWARKRNWRKVQLLGMQKVLMDMYTDQVLLASEAKACMDARNFIDCVLAGWSGNNKASKNNFLCLSKVR